MPKPAKKKPHASKAAKSAELVLRQPGQEYAQAGRMLGNGRLEALCFDGRTRLAHIRGKMVKRVWIATGDVILVALRDFQDDKVDVIHKYSLDDVRSLKRMNEIPQNTKVAADVGLDEEDDDPIEFRFEDI
jgi:translation initiation factor 1A